MTHKSKKPDAEMLKAVDMNKVAQGDLEHTTLLDVALRRISLNDAAKKLNISYDAIKGRMYRIRHRRDKSKPYIKKPGPKTRYKVHGHEKAIKEYRELSLSSDEISHVLKETINADIDEVTISRFLGEEGFPRMHNRSKFEKEAAQRTIRSIITNYKTDNMKDIEHIITSKFGSAYTGLGIFMALIEELDILKIIRDAYPSDAKRVEGYVLTLLGLKIIQKKRRSDIKHLSEEKMIALFSGRDKVLSCTSLETFDYDMRKKVLEDMKKTYILILMKYMDMSVFNIDFHVIPSFSKSEALETNHAPSRGKNMKSALVFLVQDRESKIFPYSNANVKRSEASDEVIKFLDKVEPLGIKPEWIVGDSKVTNYKNIAKIKKRGIDVVTIRRKGVEMVREVEDAKKNPKAGTWRTVRIKRTKGGYEKVKVHIKTIPVGYYDDGKWRTFKMRQLAIPDNGHEYPMFIITTDFKHSVKDIVEMYPPRWLIELGIKTQTKFFDLNQLASDLSIKIDFDTFLTQISHMLYQMLAKNLFRYENADAETIYKEFIEGGGKVKIYEDKIVVQLNRKRTTGYMINAPILEGWVDDGKNISWLGKKLQIIWK